MTEFRSRFRKATRSGPMSTTRATHYRIIELEERRVEPLLAGLKAGRALDVGAGTGRYTLKLAKRGYQVTATDPNRATLDVARESAGRGSLDIGFVQAGLENGVPAVGHYFDLVVCALVLCHVPGFDRVAADFHRVLVKPGGHLLITDFHPDTIAAGIETVVSRDGVTYQLPNEHRTTDAYLEGIRGAGLKLLEVARFTAAGHGSTYQRAKRQERCSQTSTGRRWRTRTSASLSWHKNPRVDRSVVMKLIALTIDVSEGFPLVGAHCTRPYPRVNLESGREPRRQADTQVCPYVN